MALAIAAVALGSLSLVACGSDRALVTAPSTEHATLAAGAGLELSPNRILPEGSVNTTTPITLTSLVSGTSCPTLQFLVSSYVFNVDGATQYQGGACANLQAGSKITFNGTRLSETSGIFSVTQLSFVTTTTTPAPTPSPTPAPVHTEGTVTATGAGICPELQFFFGSYAFNASYSTQYSGGACPNIKAGARVAIVGTKKDGESFVRVTSLTFTGGTTPTPEPPTAPLHVDATVSSLVGGTACPSLSFMVGPYKISLSPETTFERGACVRVAAGSKIGLTVLRKGDGTFTALKIEFNDTTNPPSPTGQAVEGEGVITALARTAACPTTQFYIGTYVIAIGASTQYVGGACTDLAVGTKVGVKGTMTGASAVAASVITVQNGRPQPTHEAVEGEGLVTALVDGTSCPSLQFRISEYTITLAGPTQFVGGSCTDVAVGKKLGVRVTMTGEKTATASAITFKN